MRLSFFLSFWRGYVGLPHLCDRKAQAEALQFDRAKMCLWVKAMKLGR